MNEFEEKRVYERFKIECQGHIKKDNESFFVKIINLSGQGLAFRTDKFIDNGEMLTIAIEVKNKPEPVSVFGEVIRSELVEDTIYEIGMKLDLTSWMKISQILSQ